MDPHGGGRPAGRSRFVDRRSDLSRRPEVDWFRTLDLEPSTGDSFACPARLWNTRVRWEKGTLVFLCLIAWLVPGAGHLWLRRTRKGLVFLVVLPLMFATGLWLEGRVFPFEPSQPLVALASIADFGVGLAYIIARAAGYGAGRVVAVTYEYGNSFLIVSGLLNFLVILDVYGHRARAEVRVKTTCRATEWKATFCCCSCFRALFSVVFANLMQDEPWEQLRLGLLLFAGFVGVAFVASWLMYPFPF